METIAELLAELLNEHKTNLRDSIPEITDLLPEIYTDEEIALWLSSPNNLLNGKTAS